ncbi:tetratricopeptide repeat protein [Pontibacter sp. Tf4]|uniref:tetratricopeptide repeat protein n=1 Tax=Pontibacter sp. Tf4 TaxID=2761620 RepID=UPI001625EADC|nr:tetratricopeptide repeat protein [Pontibacter sp. Tf4]MBB6612953.1 tetratricopeptide repeat protein [Pontibacter sp. Tf4]
MNRNQIILVIVAIALIAGIFLLPKVVVNEGDKDNLAKTGTESTMPEGHSADDGHGHGEEGAAADPHATATPQQLMELATVRSRYNKATDNQQRTLLANELAEAYATAGKYDSAGYYFETVAQARPGERNYRKAGDSYFEAFTFAATQERAAELGAKARGMYEQVLKNNPADLDAKTNVAMTYIASSSPMQGITMLREVLAADPDNQKALFNLGILSIQSQQYDKAVGHFRNLVKANPEHVEGNFYLAVSLAETGENEEAKALFNKVKTMKDDPALAASVDEYLARLK